MNNDNPLPLIRSMYNWLIDRPYPNLQLNKNSKYNPQDPLLRQYELSLVYYSLTLGLSLRRIRQSPELRGLSDSNIHELIEHAENINLLRTGKKWPFSRDIKLSFTEEGARYLLESLFTT